MVATWVESLARTLVTGAVTVQMSPATETEVMRSVPSSESLVRFVFKVVVPSLITTVMIGSGEARRAGRGETFASSALLRLTRIPKLSLRFAVAQVGNLLCRRLIAGGRPFFPASRK